MSTNVPQTIWRPADGTSEVGTSDSAGITTLSGLQIITLSGDDIIIGAGTITPIPATIWLEQEALVIDRITQDNRVRITQTGDIRILQKRE